VVLALVVLATIFYFFSPRLGLGLALRSDRPPLGTPEVVVVTTFAQASADKTDYVRKIQGNRIDYAKRHG
jgi:hypothetical protein